MKKYFVHPEENGHIWVTQMIERKKKRYFGIVFQVDFPGRWDDVEYNCHVDGCDYLFPTLEEALEHGARYYSSEPCQFVRVPVQYDVFTKNEIPAGIL